MEELNGELSVEKFKEVFEKLFYGDYDTEERREFAKKLDNKEIDLKSQILEGYYYKIDSGRLSGDITSKKEYRNVNLHCGYGGVGIYIDECRKQGLPDSITAQSIFVFLEKDYHPISKLNVTTNAKS